MQENEIDFEEVIPLLHDKIQSKRTDVPKLPKNFISSPIPLAIEDIPYIRMNDDHLNSIYGLTFRKVMIYGRCLGHRPMDRFTLYDVDDGTGIVVVKYFNDRKPETGNYIKQKYA